MQKQIATSLLTRCPGRGTGLWVLLAMAGLGLFVTSCQERAKPDPNVLARVGAHAISIDEFMAHLVRRGGLRTDRLDRRALLQEMIEFEALYVRAVELGLDRDPEVQRAYRNMVVGKLKERELNSRLESLDISAEEIERYYFDHLEDYTRPPAIRLAILFRPTSSITSPEQKEELAQQMRQVRKQALQASDEPVDRGFGALALDRSEHQATRYKGGDVGWIEASRPHAWLSRTVVEAGFGLDMPGAVSEVLTDEKGTYLLKLIDRREAEATRLSTSEPSIRRLLLAKKRQKTREAYLEEVCGSMNIETHPELLANICLPQPSSEASRSEPPSIP